MNLVRHEMLLAEYIHYFYESLWKMIWWTISQIYQFPKIFLVINLFALVTLILEVSNLLFSLRMIYAMHNLKLVHSYWVEWHLRIIIPWVSRLENEHLQSFSGEQAQKIAENMLYIEHLEERLNKLVHNVNVLVFLVFLLFLTLKNWIDFSNSNFLCARLMSSC